MKKTLNIIHFITLIITTLLIFTACVSESSSSTGTNQRSVATVINSYQTYSYDLGINQPHERATIVSQPSNFSRSEVMRDTSGVSSNLFYFYRATPGFSGNVKVEIEICKGGQTRCTFTEKLTINLTIVN
jgi:hypothetical protein